jgi:hypothetical protein
MVGDVLSSNFPAIAGDNLGTPSPEIQLLYPIGPLGRRHGYDNERVKIGVKREKLAVGGAK